MKSASVLLVAVAVVGCGAAPKPVEGVFPLKVGAAGGVVRGLADAGTDAVVLEIPAGALDRDVVIDAVLTADPAPLSSALSAFVGPQIAVTPDGTTFKKPVKLTVPVALEEVHEFDQTPADCKVWIRTADGWTQKGSVASTDGTVTVELDSLATAGAGVNFTISRPTGVALAALCVDPSGFCVDKLTEPLKAGAAASTLSAVNDGKFYYVRVQSGPKYSVVEYDLATGTNTRETQPLVGAVGAGAPFEQAVSLGPDGIVYASLHGLGLVKFPFSGSPTYGPIGACVDQVHRSDGTLTPFSVFTSTNSVGEDVNSVIAGRTNVLASNRGARVRVVPHPSNGTILARLGHAPPVVLSPGQLTDTYVSTPFLQSAVESIADDEFAVNADGSRVALSFDQGAVKVQLMTRSALQASITTVPTMSEMDFSTDDILYAVTTASPVVYRISNAGGPVVIQNIDLGATGVADADRLPLSIRRLPNRQMLVVTGATALQVLRIRPSL